jgi:putative transposase
VSFPGGWGGRRARPEEEEALQRRADHRDFERGAAGAAVEVCWRHGVSEITFYRWKAKFGGLVVSDAKRLRQLETENSCLKRLLAKAHLDKAALKDLLAKTGDTRGSAPGVRAPIRGARLQRLARLRAGRPRPSGCPVSAAAAGRRRDTGTSARTRWAAPAIWLSAAARAATLGGPGDQPREKPPAIQGREPDGALWSSRRPSAERLQLVVPEWRTSAGRWTSQVMHCGPAGACAVYGSSITPLGRAQRPCPISRSRRTGSCACSTSSRADRAWRRDCHGQRAGIH